MNPLVSIIIPVYNAEKHLNKCLNSVVEQSLKNIEVIIVDDGSTDSSKSIIQCYIDSDKRIVPIFQKNSGPSIARNNAMKIAKGDYIAFLDSDDWVERSMYEDMYNVAIKNKAEIVFSDLVYEYEDKTRIHQYPIASNQPIYKAGIKDQILLDFLYSGKYGNVCKLFSRELLEVNSVSFPIDRNLGEDWLFNMEAFTHCEVVYYIDKPYYHYRQSNNTSLMKKYRPELFDLYINKSPLESYFKRWGLYTEKTALDLANRKCFIAANGCIQNEFKTDCKNSVKQKFNNISKVVNHADVYESSLMLLKYEKRLAKRTYLKMLKNKNVIGLFIMGKALSLKRAMSK